MDFVGCGKLSDLEIVFQYLFYAYAFEIYFLSIDFFDSLFENNILR